MANKKISQLVETVSLAPNDIFPVVVNPLSTPETKKLKFSTLESFLDHGSIGGLSDDDHPQYTLKTRQIISGNGLSGGGDLSSDRTLAVGAGIGISVAANSVAIDQAANLTWTGNHIFQSGLSTQFSGDIKYSGNAISIKNSTEHTGYIYVPYSRTLIATGSMSAGASKNITITPGIPSGAKAIYIATDFQSATAGGTGVVEKYGTTEADVVVKTPVANILNSATGIVRVVSNQIKMRSIHASTKFDVYCTGYFI